MVFLLPGCQPFLPLPATGLHFEDDFLLDGRTEWKTRNTKDEAGRDGLVAEDMEKQLRCRIGDLLITHQSASSTMP
jgi:hypothetical protein